MHEMIKQRFEEVQEVIGSLKSQKLVQHQNFKMNAEVNESEINQISTETFAASHSQKNLGQTA